MVMREIQKGRKVLKVLNSVSASRQPGRHWIGGKRGEIIVGNQHVAQWEMRTFLVIGEAEKIFLHSTRNRKLPLLLLLS
jgi:hypothetical protein